MDKNIDSNGKGTTSGNTVSWISAEDWATAGGVVTDAMKNDSGACQLGGLCLTNEYGPITAENYLKSSTTTWTKLTESQISLPSASQIAAASRKTFTNNLISGLSKWLYGNLYLNDIKPYGYWTSTPDASTYNRAWSVSCNGGLDLGVDKGGNNGVRPVITVSKAQLG